jgi:nitronate monooxygenase
MRNTFMEWFGLSVPILQAPIGGAATPRLVIEVGRAGGMGSLALTWTPYETSRDRIAEIKAANVPFFINFVLRFGTTALAPVIALGVPAVTLSFGIDEAAIRLIKDSRAKAGVQVGSLAGARAAIAAGADFLVVQGMEAGGHVQSSTPLMKLLGDVAAIADGVPVIAAGGIARAEDIAACLKRGAQAVALGTRFLVTPESGAHALHKQAIVEAGEGSTCYSNCFDIDWPYAMHGVLRNSTLEAWEAAGSPAAPNRPGEGDVIGHHGDVPIIRYSDTNPFAHATGDVLAACLYAGAGAPHIHSIEPVGALVSRLWAETQALL